MKCLVTGGAGFIGSHLAERLLREHHEVVVLDDLSTGSLNNIEHLEETPGFDYVLDSLTHEALLHNLVGNVDVVFHLADAVGTRLVMESAVNALEVALFGTELVLNAASQNGKKVVLGSSSEVYGRGSDRLCREDDALAFGPMSVTRWSYGFGKAAGEHLALAYSREEKLPVVVARIFNTVGPRQAGLYGMVLPRFVEQALKGGPITVYGDGKQTRSFCYVDETVEALYRLADCPAAVGQVVNVGSPHEVSILALAEAVRKELGNSAEVSFVPPEQVYGPGFEDVRRRVPDLSRLEQFIGFKPSIGLTEVVRKVVQDLKRRRERIAKTVSES